MEKSRCLTPPMAPFYELHIKAHAAYVHDPLTV
jgi:hypothetical protein